MTRQELYEMVWQTPMTKLAKTFNLSDVSLRKICVKYNIPTPPIGYWAKRAHGKRVPQPPLPALKPGQSDTVHLVAHDVEAVPAEIAREQEAVLTREAAFPRIIVAAESPTKLHKVAAATARSLRAARLDHEGMKKGVEPGGVAVSVGRDSIERVVRIVDAVARAAEIRGYSFLEHAEGVRIVIDGVPIAWRLHETKDRNTHEPTKQELQAQAQREEDRKRWAHLYSSRSDTKAYPLWDHFPSGRLSMTFTDATKFFWGGEGRIGSWRDRKSAPLETYLDEAMRSLPLGAIAIKRRLADEAEKERLRQEERERASKERAARRHEFLLKKSEEFERYRKLLALTEHLEGEVREYGSDEPADRLIGEARMITDVVGAGFGRAGFAQEVAGLSLYTEDDPLPVEAED